MVLILAHNIIAQDIARSFTDLASQNFISIEFTSLVENCLNLKGTTLVTLRAAWIMALIFELLSNKYNTFGNELPITTFKCAKHSPGLSTVSKNFAS